MQLSDSSFFSSQNLSSQIIQNDRFSKTNSKPLPKYHWTNKQNQRQFFENLAKKFEIRSPKEFSMIGVETVKTHGGNSILKLYGGSLKETLKSIFPEIEWNPEWFQHGIWKQKKIQREFFDTLASMLHIKSPKDWGKIDTKTIIEHGGSSILRSHRNSLIEALLDAYDDIEWNLDWFYKPKGYWIKNTNQRHFLDKLAKKMKISKPSDWGKVTVGRMTEYGGGYLMKLYNKSIRKMLKGVYPEMDWKKEWFVHVPIRPKNYWDSMENQRKFLEQIQFEYAITSPSDWKKVSISLFTKNGAMGLIKKYNGSITAALRANYAYLNFENSNHFFSPKLVQGSLFKSLSRMVK